MLFSFPSLLRSFKLPISQELAWTVFRFYCGISIAIGAGWSKIPVPDWFVTQVEAIGFTFISAKFWAQLAAYGEFVGGLLVAIGLFTRLAALQLAFQFFIVAFIWYDAPEFFGMYYQQLLFWSFVLIAIIGGGHWSADRWLLQFRTARLRSLGVPLLLTFMVGSAQLWASDPIKGNGQIVEEQRMPGHFDKVKLKTFCALEIRCGAMHRVVLKGDQNILAELKTPRSGNTLSIDTDEWLQPTQLKVIVYLPVLSEYEHYGWSHVDILDVQGDELSIDMPTGSARLTGKLRRLQVHCKGGKVDATGIQIQSAEVQLDGRGTVDVQVAQHLKVHADAGTVRYLGEPEVKVEGRIRRVGPYESLPSTEQPEYLSFTVKNRSGKKRDYIILGPEDAPFSYGFPMAPWSSRKEHAPTGTRIFAEGALGLRGKLLLEVTDSTAGKTIILTD